MLISEIFYSIQGEGFSIGKPAVFLRLGGCNLKCTWCDSKYTWEGFKKMNIEQVLKEVKKYPCKHLVITGGEPALQQKDLGNLFNKLKDYYIEIETNGSIGLKINKFIEQINCSPKLNSSGNPPYPLKVKPSKKTYYKFVVAEKKDLKEINGYIKLNKIPKEKVYLMPEGVNKKIVQERSEWLVEKCMKEGYNFSPRLHIMLYGNKRKK